MKKSILLLFVFLFTACSWFFFRKSVGLPDFLNPERLQQPKVWPAGENEENHELREAWERAMLADPATGKIPPGIKLKERQFAVGLPQAVADRSEGSWASRGPWNVGGRTRALAIDVTNQNRIMAGGVSGGIWLSQDGGQSWIRKTPLNAHPGCVSIAQDTRPGHTDTWYYLSGEFYGNSPTGSTGYSFYLGDGMFKSTDNGENWAPVSVTAAGNPQTWNSFYQTGWRVITSPTDTTADVLYMATVGAIYRSVNGGQNWTVVRGGNLNNYSDAVDVAISSTGVLYGTLSSNGPQKGIWRSDNGTTWVNILPDTSLHFPPTYDRIVIGINPNNENEVYFLGSTPGYGFKNHYISSDDWSSLWKYTYGSGDGSGAGGQWENLTGNLPSVGTEFDRFACQGGYDLFVKVQPGSNRVFIGGTNIYRSDDGFTTPDNTTHIGGYKPGTYLPFFELYPNHHPDQHDLLFLPSNPNVVLTASDGGLHRTEDANAANVVWTPLNRGYQTSQFYTAIIEKATAGDQVIIGGLQDNGNFIVNSTDPNALWKQTVNGDGSFGAIPDGKPYYILSIQQGRVAKCAIDNQGNITARRRIDPIGPKKDDYMFINPLVLDPVDQNILYLPAGRRLYRQDDLDAIAITGEWDSIAQGWTQFPDTLALLTANLSAIAVSKANPTHRLYIGSSNNKLYRIDNANTGTPNWTPLNTPLSSNTAYINCITIDPDNADDVVVIYSNYGLYSMYRSIDGAQTWFKVGGNLEAAINGGGSGPSIRWMSILPFPDGSRKYFCGTSVGLFSTDSLKLHATGQPGTQWALEGSGIIGSSVVPFVDVRPSDGLVVAATHGIGMYSANFSSSVGIPEPTQAGEVRVWPVPTRDIVYFSVAGNSPQAVELEVFDLQGRVVRRGKWSGEIGQINLQELPEGTYFYCLKSKNWQKSGKLVKVE